MFKPFVDEVDDGRATLERLRAQPWFDGNVAPFGVSYSSYTSCALCGDELPLTKCGDELPLTNGPPPQATAPACAATSCSCFRW